MIDRSVHIPSLDGFRAFAVLLVFLAHAGLRDIIPGGFGVTVFFFLSGYLITTLLRKEYEKNGKLSLRSFYLRRVYRIFPPMYIVLSLSFLLWYFDVIHGDIETIPFIAQLLHFTNYYTIFDGKSNFAPGTAVYWSLSVEEHFYLLFPWLLLHLLKTKDWHYLANVLLAICGAILLWRCYLVFGLEVSHTYTYKATDTRIDSIIFGCIMGVWNNPHLDKLWIAKRRHQVLLLAASIAILLVCFLYRELWFRQTFRYTLQGLALFPIFYFAVRYPQWLIFRGLNTVLVRWIGVFSYTIYLFHNVGLALAEKFEGLTSVEVGAVGLLITLLFSAVMYFFVERYFAELRRKLHN